MALNLNNITLRISAGTIKQFPADPMPQVAISGRSNVGKSSLINTLLGRKSLARVSSSPGKTITINFYDIDKKLFLVDLPGYGFARRPYADKEKWSELTDGYFTQNPNIERLRLVLQLIDSRVGVTADDSMMLDFLLRSGIPYIAVATKTDKLNKTERAKAFLSLNENVLLRSALAIIPFSSQNGEGRDEIWRKLNSSALSPERN